MEHIQYIPSWVKQAVIYHIYPIGFFGAPQKTEEEVEIVPRLASIRNYYDYFQELGINVIQFGPLFKSHSHGYDTIDYLKLDPRLGSNELFKDIVRELHELGIKVIVDGVFNHAGRGFFSFQDVVEKKENSKMKHWHYIDFSSDNPYHDGFDYKNWEGHYSLVKLNLHNQAVKDYLFHQVVKYWLQDIDIDGWRLDVAYLIDNDFWREFRQVCKSMKQDCLLIGEMIHGPYTKWIGPDRLDAGTGYQVYKSLWSAINNNNMYELKAVLDQAFHPDYGRDKNIALVNFLGNHDTSRIASLLKDSRHLIPAFLILFTLNGIPKIYYGDELGIKGVKTEYSDHDVRKEMKKPAELVTAENQDLFSNIKRFIQIRKNQHALCYGNMIPVYADNTEAQIIAYLRKSSQQTLLIIVNTSFETVEKTIPLWNQHLDGTNFKDILNSDEQIYKVKNNQLYIEELYSCWGRILESQ